MATCASMWYEFPSQRGRVLNLMASFLAFRTASFWCHMFCHAVTVILIYVPKVKEWNSQVIYGKIYGDFGQSCGLIIYSRNSLSKWIWVSWAFVQIFIFFSYFFVFDIDVRRISKRCTLHHYTSSALPW